VYSYYDMLVDVHCHLYEFREDEISSFLGKVLIVGVAEDFESSLKLIEYSKRYSITPCVGLHPWLVKDEKAVEEARRILEFFDDVKCLGEIGLDSRFVPQTIDLQRKVFEVFLEKASRDDLVVNLHSPGAWREVYKLLRKWRIKKALFHWYTGPLDLINEIVSSGYYISINPAVRIQVKHQKVVEKTPLEKMLTESDGPYKYRTLYLTPLLVPQLVEDIARILKVEKGIVEETIYENFKALFKD